MSSGPFGDRAEAEAVKKELEQYVFEDGFADAIVKLLKFLTSKPAHLRPTRLTQFLLKELGIPEQNTNFDATQNILQRARSELEQGVLENNRLKVRVQELYEKWPKHHQNVTMEDISLGSASRHEASSQD